MLLIFAAAEEVLFGSADTHFSTSHPTDIEKMDDSSMTTSLTFSPSSVHITPASSPSLSSLHSQSLSHSALSAVPAHAPPSPTKLPIPTSPTDKHAITPATHHETPATHHETPATCETQHETSETEVSPVSSVEQDDAATSAVTDEHVNMQDTKAKGLRRLKEKVKQKLSHHKHD